jgi:hypothetical protein
MKRLLSTTGLAGITVVIAVASFSFLAQAEKKKSTGTNKWGPVISQTAAPIGNVPNHDIIQSIRRDTTTSSDPDFNDTEALVYDHLDQVAGSGTHKGYGARFFKNGDKAYWKHEGTHKTVVKEDKSWELNGQGKWEWIGGTGKFRNAKGGGTYTCRATAEGGGCNWEGETEY